MDRVVVVGLGPGDPSLVTAAALEALRVAPVRYVRTSRHPSASVASWTGTFDGLYETASSLDEVYAGIVDALVAAGDGVVYAVPGSPLVAERSVELLRSDGRVDVDVVPALSFLDLAWDRLGVDPLARGVRLVDGHRFAVEAAGVTGPMLVGQCDSSDVLSSVKLAVDDGPAVTVLQRLGLPDERVVDVPWHELDRVAADHLTSVFVPGLAAPVGAELIRFEELVRRLRAECPWDREQTHQSLTRHLLEETYEVLEAIEGLPGSYPHLEEELGDLLFQVVFHSVLGAEAGEFTLADVARGIHDKLVSRHPHVFGGEPVPWEELKRREKGRTSVFDGIPGNLPSLLYAHKVLRKAASLGISLPPGGDDVGDRLLALVDEACRAGVDPEAALRVAASRFRDEAAGAEAAAERRVESPPAGA